MVGDEDRLGFVFDDEYRVAFVAQCQKQLVHRLDVVRVQADRRFVEDVSDVRERRAQVADEFDPLGLSPGQRPCRSVQRQISESDVDERAHIRAQRIEQRRGVPRLDLVQPVRNVRDLQSADIGDRFPGDQRRAGCRVEACSLAFGAGGEHDGAVDEFADVLLHRVPVFGQERASDPRDQPVEGDVRAVDLDLLAFGIEQIVALLFVEVSDGFVRVEVPGFGEQSHGPAAGFVSGDGDGSVVQ